MLRDLWDWAFRWRQDRREELESRQSLRHNETRLAIDVNNVLVDSSQRLYDMATDDEERAARKAQLEYDLEQQRMLAETLLRGMSALPGPIAELAGPELTT